MFPQREAFIGDKETEQINAESENQLPSALLVGPSLPTVSFCSVEDKPGSTPPSLGASLHKEGKSQPLPTAARVELAYLVSQECV